MTLVVSWGEQIELHTIAALRDRHPAEIARFVLRTAWLFIQEQGGSGDSIQKDERAHTGESGSKNGEGHTAGFNPETDWPCILHDHAIPSQWHPLLKLAIQTVEERVLPSDAVEQLTNESEAFARYVIGHIAKHFH